MIVYREQQRSARPDELLRRLRRRVEALPRRTDHDAIVSVLVDVGALEAGVVDALCPLADEDTAVTRALRRAALAAGHLAAASWRRSEASIARWREALDRELAACNALPLPSHIGVSVPEGFAHYGLFPECYLVAAERLFRALAPRKAVCLGIRSIGTTLSALVAAALEDEGCTVSTYTIRPRGHPFDRRPKLSEGIRALLATSEGSHFVVVDEGPGISGSSIAGTAAALSALGIPDDHIVLLPSWDPDPETLRAPVARARWRRHRRFVAGFEEVWLQSGHLSDLTSTGPLVDISAGRWRAALLPQPDRQPAVHPQHERRKLRTPGALLRFVGLGSIGPEKLARAQDLGDAGFSPHPSALSHGFLVREFVPGTPLSPGEIDLQLLDRIADYLAHLRLRFCMPSSDPSDLDEMIQTNLAGHPLGDRLRGTTRPGLEPPVAVDARMMPHEWLRTARGYLKVDALDHHDDHFFPGPVDIAWDLAGAAIEFGMSAAARHRLVERYRRLSHDRTVASRIPYYTVAYLAARIGYASLAVETLGDSDDGRRFARQVRRYEAALGEHLEEGVINWAQA